ncbi:histone-lysine N-methyltransferase ASHR1 isoform X3 [Cornus florida]|uniref:histone-lysine N-methyltransferase ASHR1 isoform X3 n=1 Tax=Cornus florida TaxID=4283 RepID=UPI0028A04D43|nr:histone-lysine N-methyltransferase ASHR1 isoform X3 [Cornus florida]
MEDLQRGISDRGLRVSNLPEKGRCFFTTRDFSPGEVIVSEEPYVSVPNRTSVDLRCDGCFMSSNLKKCSACQAVWYCGSTCQRSDWKLHRLECQALSKLDKNRLKSLTPSIRLMVKLYLRRKLQSEKIIPATATDNYNLVEALVSHMSDVDEKQLVLYAQMANLVSLILQWPEINIKEIAENFSKLACNAHTICDSELRPLGTGLYPIVSIINHSCLPNSVLVFEGKLAVVRAVQHIPKGTEGQHEDIQESAILEGYGCKSNGCYGFLLRDLDGRGFICQQCGLVRDKEEIKKIASEVISMSDQASMSLSSGYNMEAIRMYKMIEKLQQKLYHPFSINLMRTQETLVRILMEVQDWKEALAYCRLTIPVYQRVYPGFHPLLGLQYYTSGKLEWFLGDTEDAIKSLGKAVDILRITHGTNAPFMKDLLVKLDEARAEASYKLSSKD